MTDRKRRPYRPGHYQAPNGAGHPHKPEHAKRDPYDWVTLVVAIVGVVVVCISTAISAYQAIITRSEVNHAINSQRAWVRVDIIPKEEISFSRDRFYFPYDIVFTNSGSIPARYVVFDVEAEISQFGTIKNIEAFLGKKCSATEGIGFNVFPGETVRIDRTVFIESGAIRNGTDNPQLTIRICASYLDRPGSPVRHTIYRVNILPRISFEHPHIGFRIGDRLKVSDLVLQSDIQGNSAE
jgi:hypothetical protein